MATPKRWALVILVFAFFVRESPARAQALVGDVAPDLTPCMNGGYASLQSDTGFTFQTEHQCLIFTALGGIYGDVNGEDEADFFITNLTKKNIQLNHIEIADSANANNVTFGVPSQWQAGVLPAPLTTPNWPPKTVLKLRFTYKNETIFGVPSVDWLLHVVNSDTGQKLDDVSFHAADNDGGPGWLTICTTGFGDCKEKDSVHFVLVPKGSRK